MKVSKKRIDALSDALLLAVDLDSLPFAKFAVEQIVEDYGLPFDTALDAIRLAADLKLSSRNCYKVKQMITRIEAERGMF